MTDPTVAMFDNLERREHVPTLRKVRGSVRFELEHDEQTDYWTVMIDDGNLHVARERRDADCVVHADKQVFDRVASGRQNAISALLRGAVLIEGDLELLVMLERLLPGPADATDPRQWRRERERRQS